MIFAPARLITISVWFKVSSSFLLSFKTSLEIDIILYPKFEKKKVIKFKMKLMNLVLLFYIKSSKLESLIKKSPV